MDIDTTKIQWDAAPIDANAIQWDAQETASVKPLTKGDKILQGIADPIHGGAQLLTNLLPEGIVKAGNQFNNWLADKTGLVAKLPEGGVDQQVRDLEKVYQARRVASEPMIPGSPPTEPGFDGYRMFGNVISPANFALAARAPQAASTLGRVGVGAGMGATSAAMNPITEGADFAAEKLKQTGLGALVGGAVPVVTGALSRMISPNASKNAELQLLKSEGVKPTIGQTLGGRWNAAEEKLQSIPIIGDAIANARNRSFDTFNTAAINRASGKVGEKVQGSGQAAVKQAGDAISKTYDDTLSKINPVTFDNQFATELSQLHGMAQNLTPNLREKFNKTLSDVVAGRVSKQGTMISDTYKKVDSELGNIVSKYGKSSVASEQEFGDAISQMQNLLKQQMMRSNPQAADKLKAADAAWANLVRVEQAAKSAKNAEGIFTPAQLNQAIQGADDSVRGRAVARGTALMQDLGNSGQKVIGNKVPNSFTADRALMGIGSLGAGAFNPAIPASLLGGAAMYTKPMQALMNGLVSSRPQVAQPVAGALNKYSSSLVPLGTQFGLEFSK